MLSFDQVIPWSYLYSDDIWNLVFTSRSLNSSKGNRTPDEETIARLKKRNETLAPLLSGSKYGAILEEARTLGLVDRYYFSLRRAYV